nr:IS630 family transposase [Moorena sp. SIO4A1]
MAKPSAHYAAKMEDVLSVYHRPYDSKRPVVCLDETSKAFRSSPRGVLPLKAGQGYREDYEYHRHGSAALFLSVEPLSGQRQVRVRPQRTAIDFAEVLKAIADEDYPNAEKIILIVDNLNTHHMAALYERFPPAEAHRIAQKFEWHFTPEHGSWLNVAECELAAFTKQCLRRRIPDIETLARETAAWVQRRNLAKVTIDWQFTTNDARIKLKRLYPILKEQ